MHDEARHNVTHDSNKSPCKGTSAPASCQWVCINVYEVGLRIIVHEHAGFARLAFEL